MSLDLLSLTVAELGEVLGGSGRSRAVWASLRAGADPLATDALGARARERLRERCRLPVAGVERRTVAACGTRKLLLALEDGGAVEMVVIPGRGRSTVCVSVQVGCARQCTFCVTATMGLGRSLGAGEIVEQVLLARREVHEHGVPELRNVVYMGMGEPLDNLEATRRSVAVLVDPHALAVPPRHITVSTVGTSPQRIWAARDLSAGLAWSVHAVDDRLRRELVPSTRHAMTELRDAFLRVMQHRNATLFVEMALIDGVNDGDEHGRALAAFLEPFLPEVRVNLLPLNAGRAGLRPSPPARVTAFQDILRAAGYFCMVRTSRGQDEGAACGQLAVDVSEGR